jgi:alpha-D-xyloside xylohydrolase
MGPIFTENQGALLCRRNAEILRIEAWGPDALRVRGTVAANFRDEELSALLPEARRDARVTTAPEAARIENGRLACEASIARTHGGPRQEIVLRFLDLATGEEVLAEQRPHFIWPPARHYKAESAETWQIEATFRAHDDERFWGLGQRQHGRFDQKGCVLPMLQDNSEVNIPLAVSSRGYGFLWNNPAVGRIELGRTLTRWRADCARQLDYWVTAGTPAEILSNYADATGHAPPFPAWATGFWQSRLRYRNQAELLAIARAHKQRGLPMACIVIDFFHWTRHGDWKFDPVAWPDPTAMVRELRDLGIEVMVSIWPTVNLNSENSALMQQEGWLVRADRGVPAFKIQIDADTGGAYKVALGLYDPTHPEARAFVFDTIRRNYIAHGIRAFWLDSCEPDCRPTHPDLLRFHLGGGEELINAYPLFHVRGFWEGMQAAGEKEPMFLCRSAWAGSQRYGALVWSGDIPSTFESFRTQIRAGLNIALSGIGWWTTDIGGFFDGNGEDPEFRELLVRWFQWGAFCPVFRLHGFRIPNDVAKAKHQSAQPLGEDAGLVITNTGGDNEVWSWGEEVYAILCRYLALRERLRPYVMDLMRAYSETGAPPMRPLLFEFPADPLAPDVDDCHMFGPDLLVAPVQHYLARERSVYLPTGARWTCAWTGDVHEGGQRITVPAPLERIPLFLRDGAELPIRE